MPRARIPEDESTTPSFPTTTPYVNPDQHSFVLQGITQITSDVGQLTAKVDRLVKDVASHGEKLDDVRHQVSFVKGALWVIGIVAALVTASVGLYLAGKLQITIQPGK